MKIKTLIIAVTTLRAYREYPDITELPDTEVVWCFSQLDDIEITKDTVILGAGDWDQHEETRGAMQRAYVLRDILFNEDLNRKEWDLRYLWVFPALAVIVAIGYILSRVLV